MQARGLTSLGKAKSARLFVLLAILSSAVFAQSVRYSVTKVGIPEGENAAGRLPLEAGDTDYKIGKIVWVDGKNVGAIVQGYTSKAGTFENFYACNSKMEMVAELVDAQIAHRSCRLFKIVNGAAREGDWVFLKIIPLRPGTSAEGKNPFGGEDKKETPQNSETAEKQDPPAPESLGPKP